MSYISELNRARHLAGLEPLSEGQTMKLSELLRPPEAQTMKLSELLEAKAKRPNIQISREDSAMWSHSTPAQVAAAAAHHKAKNLNGFGFDSTALSKMTDAAYTKKRDALIAKIYADHNDEKFVHRQLGKPGYRDDNGAGDGSKLSKLRKAVSEFGLEVVDDGDRWFIYFDKYTSSEVKGEVDNIIRKMKLQSENDGNEVEIDNGRN